MGGGLWPGRKVPLLGEVNECPNWVGESREEGQAWLGFSAIPFFFFFLVLPLSFVLCRKAGFTFVSLPAAGKVQSWVAVQKTHK